MKKAGDYPFWNYERTSADGSTWCFSRLEWREAVSFFNGCLSPLDEEVCRELDEQGGDNTLFVWSGHRDSDRDVILIEGTDVPDIWVKNEVFADSGDGYQGFHEENLMTYRHRSGGSGANLLLRRMVVDPNFWEIYYTPGPNGKESSYLDDLKELFPDRLKEL